MREALRPGDEEAPSLAAAVPAERGLTITAEHPFRETRERFVSVLYRMLWKHGLKLPLPRRFFAPLQGFYTNENPGGG